MNKAAILAEIREAAASMSAGETVPDDLVSYDDICEAVGCGRSKAQRLMIKLTAAGQYERVDLPWRGGRRAFFRKL